MDESELTRKAIEELMKEMGENKEKEIMPTERKKNPLGRPNKLFLGRTINSIMNHNKREADKNLQRCESKLKELNSKSRHESGKYRKGHYANSEYFHEIISSDNTNDGFSSKTREKKKKRRKKKHRSRSASSSTSCSNVTNSSSNSSAKSKKRSHKKKKHNEIKEEDYGQDFHSNYMGFYVDPNMAYAAMACSQMTRMLHQQQLQQQVTVEEELKEDSLEIPSDLNNSCHSSPESSLNISLHSSSAEEDENGVLTFKLSSDDDEKLSIIPPTANEKSENCCFSKDNNSEESLDSHISLESKDSGKSIKKETNEIYVISSSDSDELEVVEIALANVSN